jgi:UDP-N-acetylglucosamine 2-epimerase (non-hydrolysing)
LGASGEIMAIKKKILVVLGTRPEAIKMAPIIKKLIFNKKYNVRVCLTSQHKQMLQQVISLFGIKPYYDLNLMIQGQVLIDLSAKIMYGVTNIINKWKPILVLVHGDTTTSAFASVACF